MLYSRFLSTFCLLAISAGFGHPLALAQAAKSQAGTPVVSTKAAQVLDLNSATASDLKSLPGIGDAYAKRIVNGRPYTAKNQLITKGILPQSAYDRIKDNVVAHRAAKP